MTDLRRWAQVNAGPFQFSDREETDRPDLQALTDAELVARARRLRDRLERELEADVRDPETRRRAQALVDRLGAL